MRLKKAKVIMIQGTMSGVGKSMIVTALCRIFTQDGYSTAPFKSQNMALNSFVTPDGKEIGRAQAVQAEAALKDCDVRMNPILLKPFGDKGSQVILNGKVYGDYDAREYFRIKKRFIPDIMDAYDSLASENDIIVTEGAGSPAEINLRQDDIVNMGLAELIDAPVVLAGNIDPGGVFAQLYGTAALLEESERRRIRGFIINKFRGDTELLTPGIRIMEEKLGIPSLGVIPFADIRLDDEDSLSENLVSKSHDRPLDIAVVRLRHISNFTDIEPLKAHPQIGIHYAGSTDELCKPDGALPDAVIIPGTKNTVDDLKELKECGIADKIKEIASRGKVVVGICGGYQMLGETIDDVEGIDMSPDQYEGLGLLPVKTVYYEDKRLSRVKGKVFIREEEGIEAAGYEIHMGQSIRRDGRPFAVLKDADGLTYEDGAVKNNIYGTYMHGLFDDPGVVNAFAELLCRRKGIKFKRAAIPDRNRFRQEQYDKLADIVRENVDIDSIYKIMGIDK